MANVGIYDMTDTWNAGGTTFTAIKMNVTDTASAAGSRLLDIQKGGTSQLILDKNGALTVAADATIHGLTVGRGAGSVSTNTAVGSGALASNTTGSNNVANGSCALYSNTTGCNNTANGRDALFSNTTGCVNTANGVNALYANTTGSFNSANGVGALQNNTTGCENTANGYTALLANTTGCFNTANGSLALRSNTTGCNNVANGLNALRNNTTGSSNTANGAAALETNTTGICNVANGLFALYCNTTGSFNSANGVSALQNNTTGCSNVANGVAALLSNTTGCNNIGIGRSAGVTGLTPAGIVNITTECDRIVMGNDAHVCAQIKIAWTATSDCRDKACFKPIPLGLDFVRALKPTEYQFKRSRESDETDGKKRYGFLAQEVLPLEGDNPVIISADDPDKLQYTEAHMIPVLVKAIQDQQLLIESLAARVEQLENA